MDEERACGRKVEEKVCDRKIEKSRNGHRADVKANRVAENRAQVPSRKGADSARGKADRAEAGDAEPANWEAVGMQPREA